MKKTEIFKYYAFGHNFVPLKLGLKNYGIDEANKYFKGFFRELKELELPVTIKIAEELEKMQEELESCPEKTVPESMSERIVDEINKIEPALDAELHLAEVYSINEKTLPSSGFVKKPERVARHWRFYQTIRNGKERFWSCLYPNSPRPVDRCGVSFNENTRGAS